MAGAGPRIIVSDGIPYLYDRTRQKFLSTSRAYFRYGAKGRNVQDQFLKVEDGQPSMTVGDMVPRNGTIVGLTANTETQATWEVELYKLGDSSAIGSFSIAGLSKASETNLDIEINSDDIILVRAKGSNILMPRVIIEIAWRL